MPAVVRVKGGEGKDGGKIVVEVGHLEKCFTEDITGVPF